MLKYFWGLVPLFILLISNLYAITPLKLDKESFRLINEQNNYYLRLPDGSKILIQKRWLFPPDQLEEDEASYVTSFNYNSEIHSFPVGQNIAGLHISSYAIQKGGSANAAAGRDVFLIFEKRNKKIAQGTIDLNITKHRVRSMGCFWASFSNFYIGDINNDGFTDLGIITEKIWCEDNTDPRQETISISGPFYNKQNIKWHVFQSTRWKHQTKFDQIIPESILLRLPLIGMSKSPVKFIRDVLGNRIIER